MGCGPSGCGRSRAPKDIGAPRETGSGEKDSNSSPEEELERSQKREKSEAILQATASRKSKNDPVNSWSTSHTSGTRGDGRSSCITVKSNCSLNSQADFAKAEQTIIIFDWDDTLCPSSWLRKHVQFDASGNLKSGLDPTTKQELQTLADQVAPLVQLAQMLGKVIVVTNARRPWVDTSCHNFLPTCKNIIKPIPVTYALEIMKDLDPQQFEADGGCLLTETKARAMKAAVTDSYSRYPNQSWKNIVSIGDAFFEHDAIRQVSRERPYRDREEKKCRTKTVKLLEGPSIAGMVVQLSIIESWLAKIVQFDADVDIDLAADEATVNQWVAQFGQAVPADSV